MSSAEPTSGFYPLPSRKSPDQVDLPEYFPEKTSLKSVLDLYPADSGKLFSKVLLPGKGKKPDSCESWTPTFFCPSCGKPHFTKGNCKESTCPDCEVDWRFDRCQSIMERILSLKIQRKKRCRHFVVSPEVEDYPENLEDLKQLRREAYNFAKSKGVEGGPIIFHPFRILPEKKKDLKETLRCSWVHNISISDPHDYLSQLGEFGCWKLLLRRDWSGILKCVYYAPHFHVLGVGEKGDNTFEEAKDSDRFVWKGIGELSSSDDLGKCTMYLLSHAGVFEKSHYSSIVWFGSLSSSLWSLDRAVMKLKNGSTVKDFVLDLVEDFISKTHEELSGSLECDNCGAGLLHISSAPDYFEEVSEFEDELRVAYSWWRGELGSPPPEDLESESDCWEFLEKEVLDRFGVVHGLSKMVQGRSCLKVVGKIEKLGGD